MSYDWEVAREARVEALLEARDWLRHEGPTMVAAFCQEFDIDEED